MVYRKQNLPLLLFGASGIILLYFVGFHFGIYPALGSLPEAWQQYSIFLYYLFADLWNVFGLGFLFWALANQTFTTKEAKLAYPLMFFFPLLGSNASWFMNDMLFQPDMGTVIQSTGYFLMSMLVLFSLFGGVMEKLGYTGGAPFEEDEPQTKSLNGTSPYQYLFFVFLICFSFLLCHQFLSILLKTQIQASYPSVNDYNEFMGSYSIAMGYGSLILFFITFWMVRVLGWMKSVLIPPVFLVISLCLVLGIDSFPDISLGLTTAFGLSEVELMLPVLVFQNIFMMGTKATLFFATKEMAYIPLTLTLKARGKALIDMLIASMGVYIGLSLATVKSSISLAGEESDLSFALPMIILGISVVWTISVTKVGKVYKVITAE